MLVGGTAAAARRGIIANLGDRSLETLITLRHAMAADARMIARHRAEMFHDMGSLPTALYGDLASASAEYLQRTIGSGEYVGWLAALVAEPATVVAGVGMVLRRVLPHPRDAIGGTLVAEGRQGLIVNVYTEKAWRRRGLARRLMEEAIAWAGDNNLESLILHAAPAGRPLYERLGFLPTNEMRYPSRLLHERSLRNSSTT